MARGAPVAEPLYTVPYEYSALLFDADRASLYVAWPGRRVLARHDLVTGVEGDALALSLTPTDVAMTPNGRWLFVGETQVTADGYPTEQPGKIAEIDLETFTLVREIEYAYSPRHLLARDDRILVVVNPNPVNLENEVRLFHAVTGASAGRLVVSGYPLTLDPSQQSIIGYGLGNISDPNVRVFLVAEPLGFGVHWKSPGTDMGSPVYASPDGQLLVTEGSFYRGAANQAAEDMTLIRTPETALGFNQVARFEPPEGRTFLIVGVDGLAFFRRDTLEPFATATVGNAMDAAYDGAWVYALALQDWTTVQISRLANPGLGMEGNQAPVASFSWSPVNPTDRDDVRFDASTSRDEDGAPGDLRFRWDFNSDGRFETELNPDPVTFHRFRAAGPQGVTLEVRDRLGATTRVTNQFTVTALPDPGEPGVAHAPWRIPLPSTSLVFDPVRPVLYAANLTNRSLVTLDLRTGQMRRQWQLDALVSGLAVRPDGSRLYVGLTLSDPTIYDAQGSGWIAEFDLEQGRKERAFAVELGPLSLVATDAGRIVVFGESTPEREIQLYEAASGALLSRQRLQDASALALHPGQAVMYAATAEAPLGLRRYWLDPDTGLLGGPANAGVVTAGKVFPLPDGQHLLTARGVLLTASPAPQAVDDLRPVRDLGLGAVVAALSMPDRGLHGLIQWTGWLTNSLVFLREDWQTELVRLSVDHEARELARYDDRFFLAGSTKTHTWVEQHRIPARFAEEDLAPEVSLLAPEAGTVVLLGSTVELRAEVRDEDGIVTRVRFLSANEELGELLVPPYVLNWQPAAPGEYLISAIATDNLGVSTRTAPARLIVNAPPTISLSDPNAGGPLVSPASFILEAEAHDPEGAIGEVEFRYLPHREAPVRLGVVSTAPYRWELVDFMGTDGHVEAVVRDDYGASAEATRPLRLLGPVGDDLRRPLALPPLGGVVQTNNVTATKQLEETQRFWFDPAPEHSLWWAWTSPGDGVLRCSTRGSSFDAQLLIFMGTNAPTLELVAWSRDLIPHSLTKELKVAVSAQTSYLIGVASARADAAGLIRLEAAFLPVVSEPGPAPPNDRWTNAIPLTGSPVSATGTNRGATGAASHPGSGSVIADPWPAVWWTWTAPRAGSYRLSTRGSDFDTRLGVAYEVRPGVLTNLGGNDDEHPATLTSQYRLQAVQGRAYYLVVDGFAGATGNITLSIERPDELGAPGNDDFANRGQLQGSLALVAGTTFGATFEAGEPTQILTNTPAGRHTVWYSWTAPRDGWVQATARPDGPSLPMNLMVHRGRVLEALLPVVRGRLGSLEWSFDVVARWWASAGETYSLQLNSSSDTDFLVAVNATYDEELPQLGWRRTGNPPALELLLTSPGRRRLELEATSDWAAWHRVAGFWLEGTTNLVGGFDGAATARFIRILAY